MKKLEILAEMENAQMNLKAKIYKMRDNTESESENERGGSRETREKKRRENEKNCEGQGAQEEEEERNEIYFVGTWRNGRIISSSVDG